MSQGYRQTAETVEQPYGGSFGTWFFAWFMAGLGISVVLIVAFVHLCNAKVARDKAARDAAWDQAHQVQ